MGDGTTKIRNNVRVWGINGYGRESPYKAKKDTGTVKYVECMCGVGYHVLRMEH